MPLTEDRVFVELHRAASSAGQPGIRLDRLLPLNRFSAGTVCAQLEPYFSTSLDVLQAHGEALAARAEPATAPWKRSLTMLAPASRDAVDHIAPIDLPSLPAQL